MNVNVYKTGNRFYTFPKHFLQDFIRNIRNSGNSLRLSSWGQTKGFVKSSLKQPPRELLKERIQDLGTVAAEKHQQLDLTSVFWNILQLGTAAHWDKYFALEAGDVSGDFSQMIHSESAMVSRCRGVPTRPDFYTWHLYT